MATYRIERLKKEFLRRISDLLLCQVKNETAQEAVLIEVNCSRDLEHAKVYFTLIDASRLETVMDALKSVAGTIRSMLGKQMHLRQVPELHFIYDDSENKAREMDALLDSLSIPKNNQEIEIK